MQKLFTVVSIIALGVGFLLSAGKVEAARAKFRSGDILEGRNVTAGETEWSNTLKAKNLDEIEFRVFIENIGEIESSQIRVAINFALNLDNMLENRVFVGATLSSAASGIANVDVDSDAKQKIVYLPGRSVRYGPGCDGCPVSDDIDLSGAWVGKLKPGEKMEVRFWGQVTDAKATTTRSSVAGAATTGSATESATASGGVGGAAVADTTPKTGFMDPVWVRTLMWVMLGAGGVGLRQAARKMGKIEV